MLNQSFNAREGNPFYREGLCFSCTRCSYCCRYESGFVFLSEKDVMLLVKELNMGYNEVIETYCRWVLSGRGVQHLSLKETPDCDCIFWKNGCSVYEGRPLQCKTFPFWPSILASSDSWRAAAVSCPGMGRGTLHKMDEIEWYLRLQNAQSIISRRT